MEHFKRYAIYYAPRPGAFADQAAAWLGWDVAGYEVAHPVPENLPLPLGQITDGARKYGFHGTIKPPFALAEGAGFAALEEQVAALAARLAPVAADRIEFALIGNFLALVPRGGEDGFLSLGAEVVSALDAFRAPLTEADRARRRPERLTVRQCDLLDLWGYPYVMEEFRFHLTLTGDLAADLHAPVLSAAREWFADSLPQPFVVEDLCLCGEAADGRFHLVHRYALSG